MSYTGTVIDAWCDLERGRASQLAEEAKVHPTTLSKIRNGAEATREIVTRIGRIWDEKWRTDLAVAWLRDQTPENLKNLVSITTARRSSEEPVQTSELKTAFQIVVNEAEHNPYLQRVIVNMAGLVGRMGYTYGSDETNPLDLTGSG